MRCVGRWAHAVTPTLTDPEFVGVYGSDSQTVGDCWRQGGVGFYGGCGCISVLRGQGPMVAALGHASIAPAAKGEWYTDVMRRQLGLPCATWSPRHWKVDVPDGDRGHRAVLPSSTNLLLSTKSGVCEAVSVLWARVAFGVALRKEFSSIFFGFSMFSELVYGRLEAFASLRLYCCRIRECRRVGLLEFFLCMFEYKFKGSFLSFLCGCAFCLIAPALCVC